MTTFGLPPDSSSNSSKSFKTIEEAGESKSIQLDSMDSTMGENPTNRESLTKNELTLLEEIRAVRALHEEQLSVMKAEVVALKGKLNSTIPGVAISNPAEREPLQKRKPLKWPEEYSHEHPSKWPGTYGVLKYIYQRDVEQDSFLQPSDFFMLLYSRGVTGNAKEMITGQVEEMMKNGETEDAMGLLKAMDDMFRDRNADKTASNLLYVCKQFKDECLPSFLPRFQKLLARSPSSTVEDVHKLYIIENAINKTTQNYLIGRSVPKDFKGFIEFLYALGTQIEAVGLIKTKSYSYGQSGTFDDGTRGIAGGKLLGGNTNTSSFRAVPESNNGRDYDGDTKMTGVNKIRAKWVSYDEIEHRKTEGRCLRCGKQGHRIAKCSFLPPERPKTKVQATKSIEEREETEDIDFAPEDLKE